MATKTVTNQKTTFDADTNSDLTVDTNAGVVSDNTQRVVIATDDVNLAAIKTAVELIDNAISGSEMQVDIVSSALPSGAATAANQSTANTSLSNIEAGIAAEGAALGSGVLLQGDDGTDRKNINVDATTGDVQVDVTNTVTVDGSGVTQPVSGTVTANLSATDNTVLDNIDTNTTGLNNTVGTDGAAGPSSALSIAGTESGGTLQEIRTDADGHLQVDVLSGGGAGTQYTEDDAAAANPVGGAQILVRQDTPATLTTTDGDNVARRGTNYGAAYTQIVDSSGNFIDTFGGSGGTASTDDGAFTAGSGQGTPMMGFATSDVVDAGDVGVLAMDTSRNLKVSIEVDNAGIGGGTQYTEAATDASITGTAIMWEDSADTLRAVSAAKPLPVDGSGVTQPVSGTVTANLSATDNTVLDNIDTNTTGLNNCVSGTELQVDVVTSALPTGAATAANQSTANNSLSNIEAGYAAEGAALGSGVLLQGDDGTDRKNINVDATTGDVQVDVTNTVTVSGTVTANAGTGTFTVDGSGVTQPISASSLPLPSGASTAANQSTGNTSLSNIEAGFATEGSALGSGVLLQGDDGTDRTNVLVDTSGHLQVDVLTAPTTTVTGTVTANAGTGTFTVDLGANNDIQGDVAHDGADSGNPFKLGGRAQNPEAQPDEVADNDRVDALFDTNGYLRVRGDFDPSFADINDSTSGDNTIIAAAGVGKRIAVWSVMVVSDGTVDVRFEDGAAGTAFTGQIPLQAREGFTYSAGGIVPLWVGSANTLLNLELSAAVNVHGSVSYTVMDD